MKRKQSTEPDLYVVNKKPTQKELAKITAVIKEYKRKSKGTIKKQQNKSGKKAGTTPESTEIDLYVSPKKMTAKERKELGEFIEKYRQRSKKSSKK